MHFDVLKRSHIKRNIVIILVVVLIISAIILNFTRARYRVTESIPLVNGTINYSLADLNAVAIYIKGDSDYTQSDTIPDSGYVLNKEESYCTVNKERDDSIKLSYNMNTKTLSVTPMTTKGTTCYLYFDEYIKPKDFVLANYPTILTRNDFTITITETTTGTIYKSLDESQYDDYGEVYYFAGAPTDNWVFFAGFYWRIIRINGDGTIRLIYAGTNPNVTTGEETQIGTSAFNEQANDNAYVGFKYGSAGSSSYSATHANTNDSTILTTLNTWYKSNLLSYTNYLDTNAGFCGDRTPYSNTSGTTSGGGINTTGTYYGGYIRFYNHRPSLKCLNELDLYTTKESDNGNGALIYPIGLINIDEVLLAGGNQNINESYYLNTGQFYWTISPHSFFGGATHNFYISANGYVFTSGSFWVNNTSGVRTFINLSADITITGSGTTTNPYQVVQT